MKVTLLISFNFQHQNKYMYFPKCQVNNQRSTLATGKQISLLTVYKLVFCSLSVSALQSFSALCMSLQGTPWQSPIWQVWWWALLWRMQRTASPLQEQEHTSPRSTYTHLPTAQGSECLHTMKTPTHRDMDVKHTYMYTHLSAIYTRSSTDWWTSDR